MLNHLSLGCTDFEKSTRFYDGILGALGYRRVVSTAKFSGYGIKDNEDLFGIKLQNTSVCVPGLGFHVAFTAPSRQAVDRFHQVALELGGEDNGFPGLRPQYGSNYYAAFIKDPDGHAIEAVCFSEE